MMQTGYDPNHERLDRRRMLLARASLLRGCTPAALEDLARRMQLRLRPSGTQLVAQDEPATGLYLIAAGKVRVVLFGESGREITIAQLGPGDCFGESSLFDPGTFDAGAQSASYLALDDVSLLMITREQFLAHAQQHPRTALNLAAHLSRQLASAHQGMAELALETVEQRLVRTLERWGRANGGRDGSEGLMLPRRPTHQALAQMVGASRETITRTFTSLTKRQLIAAQGDGLLLTSALFDR